MSTDFDPNMRIEGFDPENLAHLRLVEEWQEKYDIHRAADRERIKSEGWIHIVDDHPENHDFIPYDVVRCRTLSNPEMASRVCDLPVCPGLYWKPLFEEHVS